MRFKNLLSIFVIFLLLFGLAFFSTLLLQEDKDLYLSSGSTYSNRPTGTKAFYLFLKEMGFTTKRWQVPLRRLKADSSQGQVMAVIDVPQSAGSCCDLKNNKKKNNLEFPDLFNWVGLGNTLLLIGDSPYLSSKNLNAEIIQTGVCSLELQELENWIDNNKDKIAVEPDLPTIYCRRVEKIELSEYTRLMCTRADKITHFQDTKGQIVLSMKHGEGKIVLISDPYIVCNQGIAQEGNIHLLSNIILNESPSKIVYFDEFDHGYHSEKGLLAYFKGTSLGWVFLQLLLIGGIYFYSNGRHFAAPKALPKVQRRSVLEYVDAMSGIYQKAGAYQLGLIGIYRRYKALYLKTLGFGTNWDITEFSRVVAGKINRDIDEIEKIFNQCEAVLKGEFISKEAALSLAKQLQGLRKELGDVGKY